MNLRYKIVNKSSPNEDGEWKVIGISEEAGKRLLMNKWSEVSEVLESITPSGFFVVSYEILDN